MKKNTYIADEDSAFGNSGGGGMGISTRGEHMRGIFISSAVNDFSRFVLPGDAPAMCPESRGLESRVPHRVAPDEGG